MGKGKQATQGTSLRGIAREWGVSPSYVSGFLKRVGIQPFPDGSYDLAGATAARKKYTLAGSGQRKWAVRHGQPAAAAQVASGTPVAPVCQACGARYIAEYARNCNTLTWQRFCSASCEADFNAGLPMAKIASRRDRGISPEKIRFAEPPKWTPPPRPTPIVRICQGCRGRYDAADIDSILIPDDRDSYCSSNCEYSVQQGLTPEEIRRHIKIGAAESGDPTDAPEFFDMVHPDGTPRIG